jgi:hypothetical protein
MADRAISYGAYTHMQELLQVFTRKSVTKKPWSNTESPSLN